MNNRQEAILRFIISHKGVSISDLEQYIGTTAFSDISRITLIRDLNFLQGQSLIQRQGQGRTTFYDPILPTPLLEYFDVEKYFNIAISKLILRLNYIIKQRYNQFYNAVLLSLYNLNWIL